MAEKIVVVAESMANLALSVAFVSLCACACQATGQG